MSLLLNLTLIVLAGLVSTLTMTLFMGLISGLGLANADMIRAIGSLFTKRLDNAFWPGVVIKFSGGVIFAFFYALLGGMAPVAPTAFTVITMMTAFGAFHGLFVSVAMAVSVSEYHPLPEFKQAGGSVVLSHLAGHLVYGLTMGLVFAMTRVNLKLIEF